MILRFYSTFIALVVVFLAGMGHANAQCSASVTTTPTCFNSGTATVLMANATSPFSYTWSNGTDTGSDDSQTAQFTIGNLAQGDYQIVVYDATGCSATADFTVNNSSITANAGPDITLTCFQFSAMLTGSSTGGTGSVAWQWVGPNGWTSNIQNPVTTVPGTYTLIVTDAATGCTATDQVVVTNNIVIQNIFITGPTVICQNQFVNLNVEPFNPTYNYVWSNGFQGSSISVVSAGVYGVTATNTTNGCTSVASYSVMLDPIYNLVAGISSPACLGTPTTLFAVGGNAGPQNTYIWSNGATTNEIIVAPPVNTTYTVTITTQNGCTRAVTRSLSIVALPGADITGPTEFCEGQTINLQATGNGTYKWSNGETTSSISVTPSVNTTYTVTVTSSSFTACKSTDSHSLNNTVQLSSVVNNVSCATGSNGSIDLSVSGGAPPYVFNWSDGSTTEDLSNIIAATYTVTVTDNTGCSSIHVAQPVGAGPILEVTNASCFGGANGAINATIVNGVQPLTYAWSTGEVTEDISNLAAGPYYLTVTDGNNCVATASATVTQSGSLNLVLTPVPATCGQQNGSITAVGSGGVGPYQYLWSNGATGATASNLQPGTFTCTLSDSNGCFFSASATVVNAAGPNVTTIVNDVRCFGGNDGRIEAFIAGGTPPYSYVWSTGQTMTTVNLMLSAGTYTIIVGDANNCTATASATVAQPTPMNLQFNAAPVTACTVPNGSISFGVAGGVPPFTYLWSNGQTTQVITGLAAGTYTLTITDANGCTLSASEIVTTLIIPINIASSITNAACNQANGSINITLTSGNGPFNYLWSNNATTQDLTNITAGTYTVTVTDGSGCTQVKTLTVSNVGGPNISMSGTAVSCFGSAIGTASVSATGGVLPYTYLWSNATTDASITGLAAGTYCVTVTDDNGCIAVGCFTVVQPAAIAITTNIQNVTCNNLNGGVITAAATGGTQPYTYSWGNGANAPTIGNLSPGTYCLTVTDANGCTATTCTTIIQPAPITTTGPVISQGCGSTTADFSSTVFGGTQPYFFQWSNGLTGPLNVFTTSGVYTATITDIQGCTSTFAVNIDVVPSGNCSFFSGRVVVDQNENCVNNTEPGISGWLVKATGASQTFYAVTDATGYYLMGVAPGDEYVIEAIVPSVTWTACPPLGPIPAPVTVDTLENLDLPIKLNNLCAALEVNMASGNLRPCFSTNYYGISYKNTGTATAVDPFIILTLDANIIPPFSSNRPFTQLPNNQIRFDLNDIAPGQNGYIIFNFKINCNTLVGQTLCSEAHIYPDVACSPNNALWTGASLRLSSVCNNDSLRFLIKNAGFGPMSETQQYIVVEDHVMLMTAPVQLDAGEQTAVVVPANGSTWRLEIPQEPYHPGMSMPALSVEGCTTGTSFTTGFVTQFPLDENDPWVDIHCQQTTLAYDPNDKQGFPVGYGPQHYIRPETELTYIIRFQNTGSDTAFTVRLVDTLSKWLDPATIRPGASSHPYSFDLTGTGVASFLFENILLPDSTTNEPASQGFVQFTIKPQADAPLKTVINNQAAIYFDFNAPIFTNTTDHKIGINFITVGLWQPQRPEYEVLVAPNPFETETMLEVKGLTSSKPLHLSVFDLHGRLIQEQESTTSRFQLKNTGWPSGMYAFRIEQQGVLVGSGRLVVE